MSKPATRSLGWCLALLALTAAAPPAPVVATAAPGTGIHAEVDGCGIATPPGDSAAFAEAIAALIDDPARRASLGAAARQRAGQRWTRDAVLQRFERNALDLAGHR